MRALLVVLLLSGCASNEMAAFPPRALHVVTVPEGVTVSATYGDTNSPRVMSCVSPCDVIVPELSDFHLSFEKAGYRFHDAPPVHWRPSLTHANVLEPSEITVTMEADQAAN